MSSQKNANIASRAVKGSLYNILSSSITIVLGVVRTVLLARLVLPEHFGTVALALFFLTLSTQIRGFGIDKAIIQRKEVNDHVLATYFTMRQITIMASSGILIIFIPLIGYFYTNIPLLVPVLFVYMGISIIQGFNLIQITILSKRLAFKHLALMNMLSSIAMTIVAPLLAWYGWGIWSLVAEQFIGVFVNAFTIWMFYRPWRPRFGWDSTVARELWNFGIKTWVGANITFFLDRFDDFWTGTFLGNGALGYYSQAYKFANYPKRIIANPVISVFFPTFARLQDDRLKLSRAFFRVSSLMIRTGFWFSMVFILTASEFIELLLGKQWLPMLTTFQLMIIYTLLDPLVSSARSLLTAVNHPMLVVRTRVIQLLVFIPSVIILSYIGGIEGVAIAADIMLVTGAGLLFYYAARFVDYSTRILWLWPTIALIITTSVVLLLNSVWLTLPLWGSLLGKGIVISSLYWIILLLVEREHLMTGWRMIWGLIGPNKKL